MRTPGNAGGETARAGSDFLLSNAKKWNTLIRLNYKAEIGGTKATGKAYKRILSSS